MSRVNKNQLGTLIKVNQVGKNKNNVKDARTTRSTSKSRLLLDKPKLGQNRKPTRFTSESKYSWNKLKFN